MIVKNMIFKEIKRELLLDRKEIEEYIHQNCINRFKRAILKANKFPYVTNPIQFKSKRNNKYLIFSLARKRSDWKRRCYIVICFHDNQVFHIEGLSGELNYYTKHFFHRYRERFLKDEGLSTLEVVIRYFKNNYLQSYKQKENGSFMASCNDGVIFGEDVGDCSIMRTFITKDMQYKNQRGLDKFLEEYREKKWKKVA